MRKQGNKMFPESLSFPKVDPRGTDRKEIRSHTKELFKMID